MRKSKEKPYGPLLERLMSEKSKLLSQAQAFAQMGLTETAQPLWRSAASLEERIAPRLDALGRSREAALHRICACIRSCPAKSSVSVIVIDIAYASTFRFLLPASIPHCPIVRERVERGQSRGLSSVELPGSHST